MGMWIGRNRKARVTYGFDEIALVPGEVTINPNEVDTSFKIPRKDGGHITLKIPIIASAMDGVTDVRFCIEMGKLGGLGVVNLEGIQTRYESPSEILEEVVKADKDHVTELIQKLYLEPIKEELIGRRVEELKKGGILAAVSSIPQKAERYSAIAQEAGADIFVVQSTVSTVRHISTEYKSLDLEGLTKRLSIPVIIGNAVTYSVSAGVDGLRRGRRTHRRRPWCRLHEPGGAGPGSSPSDGDRGLRRGPGCLFQEDRPLHTDHHRRRDEQGRRCLQSAGMRFGCGDGRQRFCAGEGSARQGKPLGHGNPSRKSPTAERASRSASAARSSKILFGPATVDDGSQNLVGAITTCMGNVGAADIRAFQETEIIIAPSIKTEGKLFQTVQSVGMGTR